jgi:hypothetical protein
MVFGGHLKEIQGKYPENTFIVEISHWVSWYEKAGGWVPYNHFCWFRRELKKRTRKQAGLPAYFTGNKNTGFKLGDIATARPFSKRERERLDHEN